MHTNLCLQFEPQKIASAAIYMAMACFDVKLPAGGSSQWAELIQLESEELDVICKQMMQVIEVDEYRSRRS